MKRIGVFLITLFNIASLLVTSVLAAAGSGSAQTGWTILVIGGLWALGFAFASWNLCSTGKNDKGLIVALLTWPVASVVGLVVQLAGVGMSDLKSSSPEFTLACKTAGVQYLAKPSALVKSIAYDWAGNKGPGTNLFEIAYSGRITSEAYKMPRFPATIGFTESRWGAHAGQPANAVGPYLRTPATPSAENLGVTELTAEALVTYTFTKIESAKDERRLDRVNMTVSDRRDARILATLTYVRDWGTGRMCGTTSKGAVDETSFIRKAVGLD